MHGLLVDCFCSVLSVVVFVTGQDVVLKISRLCQGIICSLLYARISYFCFILIFTSNFLPLFEPFFQLYLVLVRVREVV